MDDRTMLELAAKAAGIEVRRNDNGTLWVDYRGVGLRVWNPLTDDGDRYRLAKKLGMVLDFSGNKLHEVRYWVKNAKRGLSWAAGDDEEEAHAIVRAAAAIGESMKGE